MTDYTTLPLQAHDNRSAFLEDAWNIGRAYRNQAIELISICQFLPRVAPPKFVHEDAELRRIRRACDLALRSAANSGMKVNDETNALFEVATEMLGNHSERRIRIDPVVAVHSKMEIAKWKDSLERDWPHPKSDECTPTMTINFVLLRSPLLSPHDPETIIVSQELSDDVLLAEILWNFSRYKDPARITLDQNPHFYLRCPADESMYTPMFRRHPLQDTIGALEHNDTVYILFDRPARVFLHTKQKSRIFGNIWLLNGSLIFRDSSGVLEGERLIRGSSTRYYLGHFEQSLVLHDSKSRSRLNRRCLPPIVTTPSANPSSDGQFEDWTVLSRLTSPSIDIHIYGLWGSPPSTSNLDLPPPPPTSEQPEYRAPYMTINMLEDDILLDMFNYYRLDDENAWNERIGWCKLSHVCRRWRQLVYSSTFHLGMHIRCTQGTPIVDTLGHLPPLPLFISYCLKIHCEYGDVDLWRWVPIRGEDELGLYHALRLPDRVRRIDLRLRSSTLNQSVMLMDKPFPILEHLSLLVINGEITALTLPTTFFAPNLRHLILHSIGLPKRLRLLTSTISLVTLALWNLPASSYFRPKLLVARLQSLPQLEELSIGFSIPIPRPNAERELLGKQGTPMMLSKLKIFQYQGVSAYLERLVSQMRAPLLGRLDITLFNQIAFTLPHLTYFVNLAEQIKLHNVIVSFERDEVSIATDFEHALWDRSFVLHVRCGQLDWQIDSMGQICGALKPMLSGVDKLTLYFQEDSYYMPTGWQVDGTTWQELLRSFIGAKELFIDFKLKEELSRALEVDDIGSDPGFLPRLKELIFSDHIGAQEDNLFGSFIQARRLAGRPISSRLDEPPITDLAPIPPRKPFRNVYLPTFHSR